MDMNIFYRRILDFEDVIKLKLNQAVIESVGSVDTGDNKQELLKAVVERVDGTLHTSYLEMVENLQKLETTSKTVKKTRKRK